MKMAPLLKALATYSHVRTTLVHTGQHYDTQLSDIFFEELGMRRPDVSLNVGSGRHGQQTARILEAFEEELLRAREHGEDYHRVVVVGDVNSTVACTLAAVKLGIPVAHVEAGLRSFDRSMPEEINRLLTDAVSDCLFVSEPSGMENLLREGHTEDQLYLVGNIMIDSVRQHLPRAQELDTLSALNLAPKRYGVVTLHRPANVDQPETLSSLVEALVDASETLPLVFPLHPRTEARLRASSQFSRLEEAPGIRLSPPLGYLPFLCLTSQAKLIITDSGGLQDESSYLGIPCLTLRPNTERPITVEAGTSTLVKQGAEQLRLCLGDILAGKYKPGARPPLWDGYTAGRIAAILASESRG